MQFAFARLGPLFPGFFAVRTYQLWITAPRFRKAIAEHEPQVLHFLEPLQLACHRVISVDGPAHGENAGKQTNILEQPV